MTVYTLRDASRRTRAGFEGLILGLIKCLGACPESFYGAAIFLERQPVCAY